MLSAVNKKILYKNNNKINFFIVYKCYVLLFVTVVSVIFFLQKKLLQVCGKRSIKYSSARGAARLRKEQFLTL